MRRHLFKDIHCVFDNLVVNKVQIINLWNSKNIRIVSITKFLCLGYNAQIDPLKAYPRCRLHFMASGMKHYLGASLRLHVLFAKFRFALCLSYHSFLRLAGHFPWILGWPTTFIVLLLNLLLEYVCQLIFLPVLVAVSHRNDATSIGFRYGNDTTESLRWNDSSDYESDRRKH